MDPNVIQSDRTRYAYNAITNILMVTMFCWMLSNSASVSGQGIPSPLLSVPTVDTNQGTNFDPNQTLNWPGNGSGDSEWPDGRKPLDCEACSPGYGSSDYGSSDYGMNQPRTIIEEKHWFLQQMELRSSSTHGRAMGPGGPLRGTSWLNRPYEVTFESGALIMIQKPATNVRKSNDYYAALQLGWDFDHYWGSQVRLGWSTPELLNTTQVAESSADNLFITDVSFLYYPWGDSRVRPYYRAGLGLTNLEYTNDEAVRISETLLTFPFGVGLKYQFRRWAAFRLEIMNHLAIGMNETSTLNNLTVTGGFEWRFGGRPASYWAWAGRGGAW